MKKTTWIRIAAIILAALPPVLALVYYGPIIIHRADKTISVAAILVAIILICIFKDGIKRIYQTPSAIKICTTVLIFSLIAVSLSKQLIVISAAGIIGGILAMPLNMWYNSLVAPPKGKEIMDVLNKIANKGENINEESDKDD